MKDNEYIIINANTIQERIDETKSDIDDYYGRRKLLNEILSNSIPLIPEIKKAFDAGTNHNKSIGCNANHTDKLCYCKNDMDCSYPIYLLKQDYISQLTLEI